MKIEYLLIKKKNDICSDIDSFKSLLSSNTRLSFKDDKTLCIGESSYLYSLSVSEPESIGEVVFNFSVKTSEKDDNGAKVLEEFDKLFHRVNSEYQNAFVIDTIWNDFSMYYARTLYPKIIKVESLLRKIIYIFMTQTLGTKWFTKGTPSELQERIKEVSEKNNIENINENQLNYAVFIHLSLFFFTPYALVNNYTKLTDEIKALDSITKEKKEELLKKYERKSNWERYFSDKIKVDGLSDKWETLYKYRNSVAHSKLISEADYIEADKLLKELIPAFEQCLVNYGNISLNEEEKEAVSKVADSTIPQSGLLRFQTADYIRATSTIPTINNPAELSSISVGSPYIQSDSLYIKSASDELLLDPTYLSSGLALLRKPDSISMFGNDKSYSTISIGDSAIRSFSSSGYDDSIASGVISIGGADKAKMVIEAATAVSNLKKIDSDK